ncbi:hypothetical protein [Streptomyces sp. NPDC091371]|uniref:hypothetical protein n=1 Tax=Streptomyces sp. NPDC091371 TaxID=3155303 RepID=UPI00342655D5
MKTRGRTATLLCVAAALTATTVTASAAGTGRTPDPVVVADCAGLPQVRPPDYLLACGDGNNRLVGLVWDTWNTRTATARGTDMVNDCVPYCAAGRFRAYPVEVTLSHPAPWPERPGTSRFTAIRLVYPGAAPAPYSSHDVTIPLVY